MPRSTASLAHGAWVGTGVTGLVGGSGYSAGTFGVVIDAPLTPYGLPGPGAGAVPTFTIVGGVIMAVTFAPGNQGAGYLNPKLVISDPAGSAGGNGASAIPILNNTMVFTASAGVLANPSVGAVIRMGGGIAVVTEVTDSQHATANMIVPIAQTQPNSNPVAAQPAPPGTWTLTSPVASVPAPQLAGATVTGLLDGNVMPPQ